MTSQQSQINLFYLHQDPPMMSSIYPQSTSLTSSQNKVRYPEDIQIIIRSDTHSKGNLFLGNLEAAQNPSVLQNLQINAVLTAAKGHALQHPKNILSSRKYLPLEDTENCDISDFVDESVSFIADHLRITNVLVHCVSGVGRSAALVIAYLMRQRQLSLQDAFNQVKSRRKIIAPSQNLIAQLGDYQRELASKKVTNSPTYSNRIHSSMDRSNDKSKITKVHKQSKSNLSEMLIQQFQNTKSYKSKASKRDDSKINNQILSAKSKNKDLLDRSNIKNPEQSFISKSSMKQPSILNKSYASSRMRSHRDKTALFTQQIEMPQVPLLKKTSQSREEFSKKLNTVDSRNKVINQKFELVQQRFDTDAQQHRQLLDSELSQIHKMKANLYAQQSDRVAKLSQRAKSVHNQTMEDQNVKNYIFSLPL